MRMPERPEWERIADLRRAAFDEICPPSLNRKDRRTAYGRMLVAQAEAAALKAEVEYLRQKLKEERGE